MNSPVSGKNDGDMLQRFQPFSLTVDCVVAVHPARLLLLSKNG